MSIRNQHSPKSKMKSAKIILFSYSVPIPVLFCWPKVEMQPRQVARGKSRLKTKFDQWLQWHWSPVGYQKLPQFRRQPGDELMAEGWRLSAEGIIAGWAIGWADQHQNQHSPKSKMKSAKIILFSYSLVPLPVRVTVLFCPVGKKLKCNM